MKRLLIILAVSTLIVGCIHITVNDDNDNEKDYGPRVTRVYAVDGNYHELEVSHAFNVIMSDTATVATVTIDSALLDHIVFRVKDGALKIGLKPGIYNNVRHASIVLPRNNRLDDIELCSSARFYIESPFASEKISVELNGASVFSSDFVDVTEFDLEASGASYFIGSIQMIETGHLDIELSGASTADISGCTDILDIDISGASIINAKNLDTKDVKGNVGGASNADVLCCESIKVNVSGASNLTYSTIADGCEPVVSCPTTGNSTVTRRK